MSSSQPHRLNPSFLQLLLFTLCAAGLGACGGGGGAITATPVTPPASGASTPITGSSTPATGGGGGTPSGATGPTIAGCPVFPVTAIFNTRIDDTSQFPTHPNNAAWKAVIDASGSRRLHLDWGTTTDPNQHDTYWGIPYNVVDGVTVTTNWPTISYTDGAPDESDCAVPKASGGFALQRGCAAVGKPQLPIPTDAAVKVEGGYCPVGQSCPDGDHHILIVEKSSCRLWEAYYAGTSSEASANGSWNMYSSAAWDLTSLAQRPATWTSGDAAGLPMLPLLVRIDEANAGEIKHAFRVTLQRSRMANAFSWPARHRAGSSGPIPFGALMRLRADFTIPSTWTTQAKAIATAMQRYGLYVADNGSDLYVQGEPSALWQDDTWTQLQSITLSQFEFVSLNGITTRTGFNPDSFAASW